MRGVPCPACGCTDSDVKDSRPHDGAIKRRRQCTKCGERFSTFETSGVPVSAVLRRVEELHAIASEAVSNMGAHLAEMGDKTNSENTPNHGAHKS